MQIAYFVPDDKKADGVYIAHSGIVKKIDLYFNVERHGFFRIVDDFFQKNAVWGNLYYRIFYEQ